MRILRLSDRALTSCAVIAALAGCGGLRQAEDDTQPPTGAPVAVARSAHEVDSAGALDRRFRVIYRFEAVPDAQTPEAALIVVGGALFGTSAGGGKISCGVDDFCGTVYKVALSGSQPSESVVYNFGNGSGSDPVAPLLLASDGRLYGSTFSGGYITRDSPRGLGTLFTLAPAGSGYTQLEAPRHRREGIFPAAPLIEATGRFYGTDQSGGSPQGGGVVFEMRPSGLDYHVIHRFKGGADGFSPQAGLIAWKGSFYGTTEAGGASNDGIVYKLRRIGSNYSETIIYTFSGGSDGSAPLAGLTEMNGALYGTTEQGGNTKCAHHFGCGTVFKLIPASGGFTESVVYRFGGSPDGGNPFAGLVVSQGRLYGTTAGGGNASCDDGFGCGTIFELTPSGSRYEERILHRFQGGARGFRPTASLTVMKELIYGTTSSGGNGYGTVFTIKP
jgi:uncharacterized repeat protein (TIGR03803 family)